MIATNFPKERLASIDFFRGLTMFILIGEFTGLFSVLHGGEAEGGILYSIFQQFHHHPWHGLRFWDLVQPFFMFIVGLSMPIAIGRRIQRGDSSKLIWKHVLIRSALLLFLGWALYCIGPGRITFRFQNVLAQIGVSYFVAFLIIKKSSVFQIIFSLGLILIMDLVYRFFPVDGFNEAFTPDKNFGAYIDLLIGGELSGGHWTSINAISTSAHTIWGVLVGSLLISSKNSSEKIKTLIIFGALLLVAGYSLDYATPIIKRIATSSFVLVSGGYSILVMTLIYWIYDVKKLSFGLKFFAVVGMNPLLIYLFAHVGGAELVYSIFKPFTYGIFSFGGDVFVGALTSILSWAGLWYICYFLYTKKVFIRI